MSDVFIIPQSLCGTLSAPPSKSVLHRMLIASALAKGKSCVEPLFPSGDIEATAGALKAMGAAVGLRETGYDIDGSFAFSDADQMVFCGESGSTLRFLIPVAGAFGLKTVFTGTGRLPERPLETYRTLLPRFGMTLQPRERNLPLLVSGKLTAGDYRLAGDVSSQYTTGLLFALPLLEGESRILFTTRLESAAYIQITLEVLRLYGIRIDEIPGGYRIPGGQKYIPTTKNPLFSNTGGVGKAEGDWSQAAFFFAAGALGGSVAVTGLRKDSRQGDKKILEILGKMGSEILLTGEQIVCLPGILRGCEIDAAQIPDLVPVLAVLCSLAQGNSCIYNAGRLRLKESDRLRAIAEGIRSIGGDAREEDDRIVIHGKPFLDGGKAKGYHDHRIVMALAVAASRCKNPVVISDAQSVGKSYPDFFKDYNRLGGCANVICMGESD